jgi:hypothetical protein
LSKALAGNRAISLELKRIRFVQENPTPIAAVQDVRRERKSRIV